MTRLATAARAAFAAALLAGAVAAWIGAAYQMCLATEADPGACLARQTLDR